MYETFTTVQNLTSSCMRLSMADNAAMNNAIYRDIGPLKNFVRDDETDCPLNQTKVQTTITPDTWLVVSQQFEGSNYLASVPFQVRVAKSTILQPQFNSAQPNYANNVVYADVVSDTITVGLGGTPPPPGFVAGATKPPAPGPGPGPSPKPVPRPAPEPASKKKKDIMIYSIVAACIVVVVLAVVLSVVLTRRRKLSRGAIKTS